jgi:hypothetical protein
MESFPGKVEMREVTRTYVNQKGKVCSQKSKAFVLTAEQEAWLQKWYPLIEGKRLMKASGMKHATLHRFAVEMGLKKSKKGLRDIKKRQAAHIKRLCERNGYYDSLRGKPVSKACQEGTRRMWQEVHEGKRLTPLRKLQQDNPSKYRKMVQHMRESRTEIIRRENLRVKYGLPRTNRLKCIVMQKYTRSQVCHRHAAFKRGYILMQDCSDASGERWNIYYDADTQRSNRFERNLIKDGFKIKEWKE